MSANAGATNVLYRCILNNPSLHGGGSSIAYPSSNRQGVKFHLNEHLLLHFLPLLLYFISNLAFITANKHFKYNFMDFLPFSTILLFFRST